MIVSEKIDANNSFQITLSPNNSLSWGGNLLFLFLVSFPILVIAITFAVAGAPIILPFAGLEILVVTMAIWYISKRNNRQEVIKLSFDKLIIEKGIKKPEIFKELIRQWSYVFIERPSHRWYPLQIVISSKGDKVPIGEFLTEEEKEELIEMLQSHIEDLRVHEFKN